MRLAVLALTLSACSIPSVDNIKIAECIDGCALTRKACILKAEMALDVCYDLSCARTGVYEIDKCWSAYADCADQCILETEKKLRE